MRQHQAHKLTSDSILKMLDNGREAIRHTLPVAPMPKEMWEVACESNGIDKEWSIKEGKRWGADAFIGGCPVIFTKPIPMEGV